MEPLLRNKNAVARAFAREGAGIPLAGRTLSRLDGVAGGTRSSGRSDEATGADAFDGHWGEENAGA